MRKREWTSGLSHFYMRSWNLGSQSGTRCKFSKTTHSPVWEACSSLESRTSTSPSPNEKCLILIPLKLDNLLWWNSDTTSSTLTASDTINRIGLDGFESVYASLNKVTILLRPPLSDLCSRSLYALAAIVFLRSNSTFASKMAWVLALAKGSFGVAIDIDLLFDSSASRTLFSMS